jgi:hypothetical protein
MLPELAGGAALNSRQSEKALLCIMRVDSRKPGSLTAALLCCVVSFISVSWMATKDCDCKLLDGQLPVAFAIDACIAGMCVMSLTQACLFLCLLRRQ